MSFTMAARELAPGDYIQAPKGTVYFHRLPRDRSKKFTAHFMAENGSLAPSGTVEYEPDEMVEVLYRWPARPGKPA